ncbi:MAG: lysophospholipid acyltransferase family protein [Oligoflexales bacterium]|nr:lysophospholipid acyltransferase family protein [Oligoflexales bacterium]
MSKFYKILVFILLKVLERTYSITEVRNDKKAQASLRHPSGAFLLAFWHEHLLPILFTQKGLPFYTLASRSEGGELIGYQCEKYGYKVIYGSQDRDGHDKGGFKALLNLQRALKRGFPVAITVDGSIGPRGVVKAGIIELARQAQCCIIPTGVYIDRYWTLKTWDQFKIPKPFAKISVHYGDPLFISKDCRQEDFPTLQDKIANDIHTAGNLQGGG